MDQQEYTTRVDNFRTNFATCANVQMIKDLMRGLAKTLHPDFHPDADPDHFSAMSEAYHAELEARHLEETIGTDAKTHTYYYNQERESTLLRKIFDLLRLNMPAVQIELIGTWIWVSGDTRPHKEELKALKCRFHGKRQRWYYREYSNSRYSNKSMSELRAQYGSRSFENEPERKSAAVAVA